MHRIQITTTIAASRERTFEALSDHERFLSGRGLECRLVGHGESEPNGLGASRKVDAGKFIFNEDIVAFERPRCYEYRITELGGSIGRLLPFEHELGRLELTEDNGGTRVVWTTQFRVGIPILGWVVERLMGIGLKASFTRLLARADRDLQTEPPGSESN